MQVYEKADKYVIYARKSTDDPQKQVRSIDDQLSECRKLATELELNVIDEVSEEQSAKKPGRRPAFTKLLKRIAAGEVDGIIAWHPDRLARNMMEGGQIIQHVDDGLLTDMRFVSYTFNNDAAGKMMLGIIFALSKHYSDKLSVDVKRGLLKAFKEGKSAGQYKPGYYRNAAGLYAAHETNFPIIQRAWQMRVAGKPETEIVEYINKSGYKRQLSGGKREAVMTKQKLNKLFADPIYMGILKQAKQEVNLTELYEFDVMVRPSEFDEVQKTKRNHGKMVVKYEYPMRHLIYCAVCDKRRVAAPSRSHSGEYYLYYRCENRSCKSAAVRLLAICKAIEDFLEVGVNWSKLDEKAVLKEIVKRLGSDTSHATKERRRFEQELRSAEEGYDSFIEDNFPQRGGFDEVEKAFYERKKEQFRKDIETLKGQIADMKKLEQTKPVTAENVLNTLKNSFQTFKEGDHLVKDQMAKMFFSNIHVQKGEKPILTVKEAFQDLVNCDDVISGRVYETLLEPTIKWLIERPYEASRYKELLYRLDKDQFSSYRYTISVRLGSSSRSRKTITEPDLNLVI